MDRQRAKPIKIHLSLNGQEWVDALSFRYADSHVERLQYMPVDPASTQTPEELKAAWIKEEPEQFPPEGADEEALKKYEEDCLKIANEQTEETATQAKRRGVKMFIHGTGFVNNQYLQVAVTHENGVSKMVKPVFKNSKKLGIEIPDMG